MTLFSRAEYKFKGVEGKEDIPTENFLLACNQILPFIELMGPIAFKLPKADLNGHIQRLMSLYKTDCNRYSTLQSIVEFETKEGINDRWNSCTTSLLWIIRALHFIYCFLLEFLSGKEDLTDCARVAYEDTLKQHHGWIVRGLFYLIIRALPYRDDFITALKVDPTVSDEVLYQDIRETASVAKNNIDAIYQFYVDSGQNVDVRSNGIQFDE